MKLYGALSSPFVARCWLAVTAKGGSVDLVEYPDGITSAGYRALNPMSKIPVLVDGDVVIPESAVICEYLDAVLPGPPLLPGAAAARARVRLLCRIADLYLFPSAIDLLVAPVGGDAAVIEPAMASTVAALGHLEHFLDDIGFAYGTSITLADCTLHGGVALALMVLGNHGMKNRFDGRPKLAAWWGAIRQDPVLKPALERIKEVVVAYERQRGFAAPGAQADSR
ncbi:MAG: glutathione S-transferase family protein [Proteobacteria bacterium]|nr:glutathione S-transferase family protein [Pseudomonadota bacterium]MDA1059206.1 glutathione S-transferase family protein [Pseudomonadota bacterium]